MKNLELEQMELLEGGRLSSYDKCVLGAATTGGITAGLWGLATGPGAGVAFLGGWIFSGIAGMAGCAVVAN